jgi:hypothetical protein
VRPQKIAPRFSLAHSLSHFCSCILLLPEKFLFDSINCSSPFGVAKKSILQSTQLNVPIAEFLRRRSTQIYTKVGKCNFRVATLGTTTVGNGTERQQSNSCPYGCYRCWEKYLRQLGHRERKCRGCTRSPFRYLTVPLEYTSTH